MIWEKAAPNSIFVEWYCPLVRGVNIFLSYNDRWLLSSRLLGVTCCDLGVVRHKDHEEAKKRAIAICATACTDRIDELTGARKVLLEALDSTLDEVFDAYRSQCLQEVRAAYRSWCLQDDKESFEDVLQNLAKLA